MIDDDFRDEHERAMRDHILASSEEHVCDDLCSDVIVDRLVIRLSMSETLCTDPSCRCS